MRFKGHFKNLNYYSLPTSILFYLRKRLNFLFITFVTVSLFVFTLL